MIYLQLFWVFFKIGLFTIGGGYAMIPLISAEVVGNNWLTSEMLINFIAISESTPGPFAINIATFVGTSTANFWGGVCATLGVVMPSFIIILLIAMFFQKFTDKQIVKDAFYALGFAVIGLIFYAFFNLGTKTLMPAVNLLNLQTYKNTDFVAIIVFVILLILSFIPFKIKNKPRKLHPVLLIFIGAIFGIVAYGLVL